MQNTFYNNEFRGHFENQPQSPEKAYKIRPLDMLEISHLKIIYNNGNYVVKNKNREFVNFYNHNFDKNLYDD